MPHNNPDTDINKTLQLPIFTSHEALHLPYEQSLTRQEPLTGKWHNLGTHFSVGWHAHL